MKQSDQFVVAEPKKAAGQSRDLSQWYQKHEQIGQGDKLDEILQMLKRIQPDGHDKGVPISSGEDTLFSFSQQGSNRTKSGANFGQVFDILKDDGRKRDEVDLKKILEQPSRRMPPIQKVPLDQVEYMHEPHFRESVSVYFKFTIFFP